MSANDYWAKAQSGSPGTNLAEMQARLYAGETTQRMMEKFDHKLQTFKKKAFGRSGGFGSPGPPPPAKWINGVECSGYGDCRRLPRSRRR